MKLPSSYLASDFHIANAEISMQRIEREIARIRMDYPIDMSCVSKDNLHFIYDDVARHLILSLQAKVASKKFDSKIVRFPADWWQSFKKRFFTPRMLKKWPVVWDEVTLEATAYHPDISIPDRQTFVQIVVASRRL